MDLRLPRTITSLIGLGGILAITSTGCTDADGDGHWAEQGDCNDEEPGIHPEAAEFWDGLDNDCDGLVDVSALNVFISEDEPNDTTLGSCFAPLGQDLGDLAPEGHLTRIEGRIETVVDHSYTDGDLDCYAFSLPPDAGHLRLKMVMDWTETSSDLDLALYGLWEGAQSGFAQSQASGPPPEELISSSGFDGGSHLWLWVAAYEGPPTDYRIDLVLR